jgi:hypothetical protein
MLLCTRQTRNWPVCRAISRYTIFAGIQRGAIEYHDGLTAHTRKDLKRRLAAHGYRVHTVTSPVHAYFGFLYAERL